MARSAVAFGFKVHTGWAALIAATAEPVVLHRERLELLGDGSASEPPRFVYHASVKLPVRQVPAFVREAEKLSLRHATAALKKTLAGLKAQGHEVRHAGLITGNQPLTAPLETILAAHNLLHAAEGELFRGAIERALEACGVEVTRIRARDLYDRGAREFGVSEGALKDRLAAVGKVAGRPWALDQKEALLAAWLSLGRSPL